MIKQHLAQDLRKLKLKLKFIGIIPIIGEKSGVGVQERKLFMSEENLLFTISEVSRRLNIPKHTIRFWERVFEGLINPLRTKGGQRRFTPQHLILIQEIKELKEIRMSLSEIKKRLNERLSKEVSNPNKIDQLATRVAEVVKTEIYHFLIKDGNT